MGGFIMKALINFSVIVVFFFCNSFVNPLPGQEYTDEEVCSLTEEEQRMIERTVQLGGRDITSIGTVRALMLFIDFLDDNEDPNNPVWPVGLGPNYLDNIIDPLEGQPAQENNITSLLADNSFNQFIMVGEAIYRQAPRSLSDYQNDPNTSSNVAHWATRETLVELDQEMDFSPYDNWEKIANYVHEEQPDSVIDMIFVVFRRWYSATGFYSLGWASMPGSGTLYVDGGERWINFSQSGVTSLTMPQYKAFQISLHEFGHKWGLPHNYNDGMWTLMSYWQHTPSPFMNSYERERLAWMTFTDITVDNTNATVADFGTAAVAYRLQINANKYYLVENHQNLSPYDMVNKYDENLNPFDAPGLYNLFLDDSKAEQKISVVCADGLWDWDNPYWIHNPWSQNPEDSIPVYDRLLPNRLSGLSDKDKIPHTKGGIDRIHAWLDDVTDDEKHATRFKGLGSSRWTPDVYNIFSPWSNPPSANSIGVEVWGQSGTNMNVKFYVTDPELGPPSLPQNFQAVNFNGNPRMTWDPNLEPDLAGYLLYKYLETWSSGNDTFIISIHKDSTGYTDEWFDTGGRKPMDRVTYWLSAVDSSGLESLETIQFSFRGQSNIQWRQMINPNQILPDKYYVSNNYPNPFNYSTEIKYELPEDSFLQLVLYDVLGREIRWLKDGNERAGFKQLKWNGKDSRGKNVPSGIYVYRFIAKSLESNKSFSRSKKMVFLK